MNVVKYLLARVATETIAGVTKICDNFRSLTPGALTDKVGKDIATELDSVWGGEYGGGRIEDTSVPKVVGKRYLGEDGKAYICKVASHINTPENYLPCNVVDNLDRIENLSDVRVLSTNSATHEGESVLLSESFKNYKYLTFEYGDASGLDYMIKTILSESVIIQGFLHLNSYDTGNGSANEVSDEITLLKVESEVSIRIITKYANGVKLPINAGYVNIIRVLGSN